ncbi:AsmA family protein [Vibrio sagamiensis]|uniref:Cell envelope biogenesis protein AsmA n=1 Tax=Vibrio sagamiensis NBRC 104589 TaxID=1219064 RepID=A0A511QGC1_9VIBR|nr:AsmA family protein [Vibrio sagamiensis]PNQ69844.1 AsmA family protein [Vibrio agarivorans]GEM76348.1 cell envelope biogenesis protein AsmA [Vibrio sagamiensis NBRC 104589]
MKKLLLVIAVPIIAVLGVILALVLFINPNQFKPLIVEQAHKQTGLELVIDGDISWTFFPSLGLELGKTELKNPPGFNQANLFSVDRVSVDVSVMPLLSKQLQIGNVTLDGANFYIETLKDGRKNLDSLTKAQSKQAELAKTDTKLEPKAEASPEPKNSGDGWVIELAGVTISNGSVEMVDQQTGSNIELDNISLNLSQFAFEKWTSLDFGLNGKMNDQSFSAQGSTEFNLTQGLTHYELKNTEVEATYADPKNQFESLSLRLETFDFDKANRLTYAIKGQANDMTIDMQGTGDLTIDKALSTILLKQLTLKSRFDGKALPQSPMNVAMDSDLSFDLNKNHLSFVLDKLTANAISLDGKADVTLGDIPKIRFTLHSPNINLDEFLGHDKSQSKANNSSEEKSKSIANNQTSPEVEPDLSALKALDVKGSIAIDQFKAANASMSAVKTSFSIQRGIAELTSFSSKLYQGSINATAKLDATRAPARYQAKSSINNIHVQPLLKDVADNDKLEGTGSIDLNVNGRSLTSTGIKKNLVGTVAINFADGAVNGINVAQLIRENYARFKGEVLDASNAVKKTDFSAMTATLSLNKGTVSTNNLKAQSPLLRVQGKGKANYLNETVDFTISTSIVGSLEGQGGQSIDELKDLTIPINVSGKWSDPKFKLVFDDILKQKAQKEIDRGLDKLTDKIKDEKVKDAVDGILNNFFK